jgi:hypothetical protein
VNIEATPMSFDGNFGVFLTAEDYATLCSRASGQETSQYQRDLETENQNLRNSIQEVWDGLTTIRYNLGNA